MTVSHMGSPFKNLKRFFKKKNTCQRTPTHPKGYPRSWLRGRLLVRMKTLLRFGWFLYATGLQARVSQAALARAHAPPLPHLCGPHRFPDWDTWQPGAAWGNNCDPRLPSPQVVDSLKSKCCLSLEKRVGPTLNVSWTSLQMTNINYIYTHTRTRTQLRPLQMLQMYCLPGLATRTHAQRPATPPGSTTGVQSASKEKNVFITFIDGTWSFSVPFCFDNILPGIYSFLGVRFLKEARALYTKSHPNLCSSFATCLG